MNISILNIRIKTRNVKKLFVLALLLLPIFVFAKNEIVVNEISWMGQKDSYSKEWIELYNTTDKDINLSGWKLKITKTEIPLKGVVNKKSYYLIERNNDGTVASEKADLIFKKALNNKGEKIILIDNNGTEANIVDCSGTWFAGDNKTKQTMERKNPLEGDNKTNWQTSETEGGTPKKENSSGIKKEDSADNKEQLFSSENETKNNTENNLPVPIETYLIAGIVSIFSAGSVLAVKKLSK